MNEDPIVEAVKPDEVHGPSKEGENLPATKTPPNQATEMLRQILEEILQAERKRMRNELFGISFIFLIVLLVVLAGGFYVVQNMLKQMRDEREMTERVKVGAIQRMENYDATIRDREKHVISRIEEIDKDQQTFGEYLKVQSAEIQEFKKAMATLLEENRDLASLVKTQDETVAASVRETLHSSEATIADLREKVTSMQSRAVVREQLEEAVEPPALPSLKVPIDRSMTLRMPIPVP